MPRYRKPEPDQALFLNKLKLTLPTQPPPARPVRAARSSGRFPVSRYRGRVQGGRPSAVGQMGLVPEPDADCTSFRSPVICLTGPLILRRVYETEHGELYQADCLELLGSLKAASVHTFFADPPFNLKKNYGLNGRDDRPDAEYLEWSKKWISEAVRVLVPGGALFIYNLPRWLIEFGGYLNSLATMKFKHWVAIDKAHSLPIPNRLSPSHYGMLYYIKGERPRLFDRDAVRIPVQTCRHCGGTSKTTVGTRSTSIPKD